MSKPSYDDVGDDARLANVGEACDRCGSTNHVEPVTSPVWAGTVPLCDECRRRLERQLEGVGWGSGGGRS